MKKIYILSLILLLNIVVRSQNFIDNYLLGGLNYVTVAGFSDSINKPRDLDFKPNTNELWVQMRGNGSGAIAPSFNVIIYNAGLGNQTTQYRREFSNFHFSNKASALAFSDMGEWASVSEWGQITPAFEGPSLWSSDTAIYTRVGDNTSHLSMLHQSPYSMGIAHDSARRYWVFDGFNGDICKYDFATHHGPGYDDHSSGKIWRYSDINVTRVPEVPSHLVKDKNSPWLYFVDGGNQRVRRLNTSTGTITGTLNPPSSSFEPLAGYYDVTGSTFYTIDNYTTTPCGIDHYNNRLIVGDYTNGNISLYNTTGAFPTLLGVIATGTPGIMGVKFGPEGKIWYVNYLENKVVRIDPQLSTNDAGILHLTAPSLTNYDENYYATGFNTCANTIAPSVILINSGSNNLLSAAINYRIDNGTVNTFNWTGNLAPGGTLTVNLPAIAVTPARHKLKTYTSLPNGNPDPNPGNDTREGSFRIVPTVSHPYIQNFTPLIFPPAGCDVVGYNRYTNMSRVPTVGGFGFNTGCLRMNNKTPQTESKKGQVDYFILPRVDLTSAPSSGTVFEFNYAYAQTASNSADNLKVKASTDCGLTWTDIYDKSGAALSTGGVVTGPFIPTATEWKKESISLNVWVGQPVLFLFATKSDDGNDLFIDDIFIGGTNGLNETSHSSDFNVYPNPSSGKINVGGLKENCTVSVKNILGEELMHLTKISGQAELDLSGFSDGFYFISIGNGSAFHMKKIIISR